MRRPFHVQVRSHPTPLTAYKSREKNDGEAKRKHDEKKKKKKEKGSRNQERKKLRNLFFLSSFFFICTMKTLPLNLQIHIRKKGYRQAESCTPEQLLEWAISLECPESVRCVMENYPTVNIKAETSFILPKGFLHFACSRDLVEIVSELLRHPDSDVNFVVNGFTPFYLACINGSLRCARLLSVDPKLNIHFLDSYGYPVIVRTAQYNHDNIIRFLSCLPGIDVNATNVIDRNDRIFRDSHITPLQMACLNDNLETVQLLLENPKVNTRKPADVVTKTPPIYPGFTPFGEAVSGRGIRVMKYWIALGKEVDMDEVSTVINKVDGDIEDEEGLPVFRLLGAYTEDPVKTRSNMIKELDLEGYLSSRIYALVIFLCDGLLEKKKQDANKEALRFFSMVQKLPMEIQMMLCRMARGFTGNTILDKDAEKSFRQLAWSFSCC